MEVELLKVIAEAGISVFVAGSFVYFIVWILFPRMMNSHKEDRQAFLTAMQNSSDGVKALCEGQRDVCDKLEGIKDDTEIIKKKLGA